MLEAYITEDAQNIFLLLKEKHNILGKNWVTDSSRLTGPGLGWESEITVSGENFKDKKLNIQNK